MTLICTVKPALEDVRKTFTVTFEADEGLGKPVIAQTESLTEELFDKFFIKRNFISKLIQPDGQSIYRFKELVDGGFYRAVSAFGHQGNRYQVDDQILEIESSNFLVDAIRKDSPNVHTHQNLTVYPYNDTKASAQFDAVVHGDVADDTFAIVLEAKYKVHREDFKKVLDTVKLFESFRDSPSLYSCTSGYDITVPKVPFDHYNNVRRVVPCLAGKHFPPELVEACKKVGIIPIYPSGARYTVENLHLLREPSHK